MNKPEFSDQPIILWQNTKNSATPGRYNLPLSAKEIFFLSSPAKDESLLRTELIGKNTIQAINIIAKEFIQRFECKSVQEITRAFMPEGRAVSWKRLEINICLFCKQFSRAINILEHRQEFLTAEGKRILGLEQQKIDFFDKIRYIIRSLSRNKDYKIENERKKNPGLGFDREEFKTCIFFWRSVAPHQYERKIPLCCVHKHFVKGSSQFRRLKNMQKRMLSTLEFLQRTVPTQNVIRKETRIHPRNFYFNEVKKHNGHFPALADYLSTIAPYARSGEDIVRALEFPLSLDALSDDEKKAWEFRFGDLGAYFELNYEQIMHAEAWLRVEATYKHGGKRSLPHPPFE